MKEITFPAWFNGPDGKTAVFESAEDVPTGWTSGSEKQTTKGTVAKPAKAPAAPKAKPGRKPKATPAKLDL